MKFLVFSDIHGDRRALESLLATEADYYFAAGDLANWGRGLDPMGEVLRTRAGRMYVIPGNHESEGDIRAMCDRYGLHYFHGASLQAGDWNVAGLGYSNPTPFATPGEYSEAEIERRLNALDAPAPLVLICHCPPRATRLDTMSNGGHAGSTAIRQFIELRQPAYFFCGHIHEAAGVTEHLGSTYAVNCGKRGFLLDFDHPPVVLPG